MGKKTGLAAIVGALALLLGGSAASAGGGSAGLPMPQFLPHIGMQTVAPAASTNLTYHHGWVMRTNTTYTIYWVPSGYHVSSTYQPLIDQYLSDVAAASGSSDNVYASDTQYYDTTGPIAYASAFGGSYLDTRSFPANGCNDGKPGVPADPVCLTDAQLEFEIQSAITHNGWPNGKTSVFFVMTPNTVGVCYDGSSRQCTTNIFCAYHSGFDGANGQPVVYAVQPYVGTIKGCHGAGGAPNGDPAADTAIDTMSHEHNESITDPWYVSSSNGGWINGSGDENGDLCAWQFGPTLGFAGGQPYDQTINGDHYEVQMEYSNDGSSCVARYPTGPPGNSKLPQVSGRAKVGGSLSATPGTWSGASTFAYQWLRCATNGSACTAIVDATTSAYAPTAADAGHALRVTVTASSDLGSTSVTSARTAVIVMTAPHVSAHPTVHGTTAVGKALTTTVGAWTQWPTRFTYHWLRCAANGGSCRTIAGVSKASYRLRAVDTGHVIRSEVRAANAAGASAFVKSRATALVS